MKKVWTEFKLELAYTISDMWYFVNRYVMKHSKRFNKTVKKFVWDAHMRWFKHFISLYEELEAIEQRIRG